MPKCQFCGNSYAADAESCPGCGAKIIRQDNPYEATEPDQQLDSLENRVLAALRAGRKVEAVKLYRAEMGVGLKPARQAVETLAKKHEVNTRGTGCAGILLLLAAIWTLLAMLR